MANAELETRADALLAAARSTDDPTPDDRTRIDAAFATQLASLGIVLPKALPPAPTAAPVKVASASVAKKLALVALGALATGAVVAVHSKLTPATTVTPNRPTAALHAPPPAAPAALPPAVEAEPTASGAAASDAVPEETAPAPLATRAMPTPSATRNARKVPASDALSAELALIEAATSALHAGKPIRALESLALHAQRYPSGSLREERDGLRVLSLCAAGELGRGRAEQQRFLERAPQSVLAEQVRAACATNSGASRR